MIYTLHIDDKIYRVPDKLSIKHFKELANWDIQLEENWRKIMSILMEVPYEEVQLIPDKTIELAIAFLLDKIYPEVPPKNDINIKDVKVGLFIDMEVLISKGVQNSIYGIIKKLYNIEPTDDMMLEDYWGGIKYYLNWRLSIFNSYRKLFGLDDEFSKNDIELEEKVDPSYNWYQFIMVLADENFLNINKVVDEPIIQALNFLAYKKDKAEEEQKRLNEIQRNSRLN
jgi:hypothetical protein